MFSHINMVCNYWLIHICCPLYSCIQDLSSWVLPALLVLFGEHLQIVKLTEPQLVWFLYNEFLTTGSLSEQIVYWIAGEHVIFPASCIS